MGSGTSKSVQKTEADDTKAPTETETKCIECHTKISTTRRLKAEEAASKTTEDVRFHSDINDTRDYKEFVEVNKTTKKFFFYPNRQQYGATSETLFVSTSVFPYTKPKVVTVHPRSKSDVDNNEVDESSVHRHSLVQNTRFKPKPTIIPLNHQNWSSPKPNILPKDTDENFVIPHRTILELRLDRQSRLYGSRFNQCDLPSTSHPSNMSTVRKRPPTPVSTDWFPLERTNDCLVASSLLAMEQNRARLRHEPNIHANDF